MLITVIFGWCKNSNIEEKISEQLKLSDDVISDLTLDHSSPHRILNDADPLKYPELCICNANKENNESPTGFYCVMPNATGYKLAGKTKPADNNYEYMEVYDDTKIPNYIMWDITYENIKMHSYKVHDLVPFEDHIGHTPYIREFDTLTITK